MNMQNSTLKKAGIFALALFMCAAMFALVGCSGTHQLVGQGKTCSSCHSDSKTEYTVTSPKDAIACGGEVEVSTSASEVYVCEPTFISEDGSKYVPVQKSVKKVDGGSATIQLEEGNWVICTADDVNIKKAVLLTVSSSGAGVSVTL